MEDTSISPIYGFKMANISNNDIINHDFFNYDENSWPPPNPEHLSELPEVFEHCYNQLYPAIENYPADDHVSLICDYCNLSQEGVQELYSDQTCLSSDLYPMPLFITLFGVIFIFGAFGNLITFVAGIKFRKKNPSLSAMFLFISNLAAGDFLMVVLCVPATFVSTYYLRYWPFQKLACVAVSYAQAVSVFVSAYSLVAISVDRYIAVVYFPYARLSRHQAWLVLGAVWVLALLTCVPVAIYSDLVTPDLPYYILNNKTVCSEVWPDHLTTVRKGYSIALLILHYFLPVAVMISTYGRIACKIWASSKEFKMVSLGKTYSDPPPSPTSRSGPIKTIRMSLTVVLVYSLCWLPYNVLLVIAEYNTSIFDLPGSQYLHLMLYWLAMLHTVLNFVLIYALNPLFRAAILSVIKTFSPCCTHKIERRLLKLERRHSSIRSRRNTLRTSVSTMVHHGVNNCTAVQCNTAVRSVKATPCEEAGQHLQHAVVVARRSDSIKSSSTRSTSVQTTFDDVSSQTWAKIQADDGVAFDVASCQRPNNPDSKNSKDAAVTRKRKEALLEKPRGSIVKMFVSDLEEEEEVCLKQQGTKFQTCFGGQDMETTECRKVDTESKNEIKNRGIKSFFFKERNEKVKTQEIENKCDVGGEVLSEEEIILLERTVQNDKENTPETDEIEMEDEVFA